MMDGSLVYESHFRHRQAKPNRQAAEASKSVMAEGSGTLAATRKPNKSSLPVGA